MRKNILVIMASSLFLSLFGQTIPDCFTRIKQQHSIELRGLNLEKKFSTNLDSIKIDSTDISSLSAINKRTLKNLIGCQLPDTSFKTVDGKILSISDFKTRFTILNFNTVYCDNCSQLEDLLKLKTEKKEDVTIILLYFNITKDIQSLIDKYKNAFVFVPDSWSYYEKYSLGQGYPLTYLLTKNNTVKYAVAGTALLYKELNPFLK